MTRGSPYVVFTSVRPDAPDDELEPSSPWASHRLRLLEAPPDDLHEVRPAGSCDAARRADSIALPDAGIIWRLFSPHHRDLGCSARAFASLSAASRNARSVIRRADHLRGERVTAVSGLDHAWYLSLDRRPVLMANRWWESWRERDKQLDEVLRFVPAATVALVPTDPARSRVRAVSALAGFAPPRDEPRAPSRPIAELMRRPRATREVRRSWT